MLNATTKYQGSLLIALTFLILSSCSAPSNDNATDATASEADTPREFLPLLGKALDAHGGINKWSAMRTLEYDIVKEEGPEHQLIDLWTRKVRLSTEDWTVGFDGTDVWVMPDSAAVGRMNARFYHNLVFYFFALPYLAADPGVNHEDIGPATVNGKTYDRVLMTFDSGVGDAPEDKYILYFNEEGILQLINYSVTYFDASRADRFNAIWYDDWTPVNGLLLPKTHIGYRWQGDSLGEQRYVRRFDNIKLSGEPVDTGLFEKPDGAYVSPL